MCGKTFTLTWTQDGKVFDIFHTANCQSQWVIYIIECEICKLQYGGKSETGFNLRLNNHKNHVKKGVAANSLGTFHITQELVTLTMMQ